MIKFIQTYSVLLLATFLFACQDEVTQIINNDNIATALKDSSHWTSTFVTAGFESSSRDSLINITIGSSEGPGLTQDLYFRKVPVEIGNYKVVPTFSSLPPIGIEASLFEIEGGDAVIESFEIDTSKINSLRVESFDPFLRKIKISFEAHFVSKHIDPTTNIYTDFVDGKITTIVD